MVEGSLKFPRGCTGDRSDGSWRASFRENLWKLLEHYQLLLYITLAAEL